MNLAKIRAETPGTAARIHFDNAGSSLAPEKVYKVQKQHLDREAQIGGYLAAEEAGERLEAVYTSIARLIGANADEIGIMASATDAWDRAFYSVLQDMKPGDRIITSQTEYRANFVAYLHAEKRHGIRISVIDHDETGAIDLLALENSIDDKVRLIALSHVPSSAGHILPASKVGKIARAADIPFLLDACQSLGQLQVDVEDIGCDILTGTGRKFLRGPRGMGFLYFRRELLEKTDPVMMTNQGAEWVAPDQYEKRHDARVFEAWERNAAGQLGLGTAIDYALGLGMDAIELRAGALAVRLRDGLRAIPGVTIADLGHDLSAIVTFQMAGYAPGEIKALLEQNNIAGQVAVAEHTLLDMTRRGFHELVRLSPHYYNTEEEVDRTITLLDSLRA